MFKSLVLLVVIAVASACATSPKVEKKDVINAYSDYVYKTYSASYDLAVELNKSIKTFTKNPTAQNLELAKEAWKKARAPYGESEVFRFYNGPIDRDGGPEGLLNAWPLDEVYIDYVVGKPNSGIVNNTKKYPKITKELLESLNELDGEKNVSTGYHAIEFLLWGQDLDPLGPGKRPYTDYVEGKGKNAKRRALYLNTAADMLVEHLEGLKNEWAPEAKNFRAEFVAQDLNAAIKNIFNGIVFMAGDELSGERMFVAYETKGQEDEHSCFSDMTHMDIIWNFNGIENVLKQTKFLELKGVKGSAVSKRVEKRLADTRALLTAIPAPFDQAILNDDSRKTILASVESLEALAKDLVELVALAGVKIDY